MLLIQKMIKYPEGFTQEDLTEDIKELKTAVHPMHFLQKNGDPKMYEIEKDYLGQGRQYAIAMTNLMHDYARNIVKKNRREVSEQEVMLEKMRRGARSIMAVIANVRESIKDLATENTEAHTTEGFYTSNTPPEIYIPEHIRDLVIGVFNEDELYQLNSHERTVLMGVRERLEQGKNHEDILKYINALRSLHARELSSPMRQLRHGSGPNSRNLRSDEQFRRVTNFVENYCLHDLLEILRQKKIALKVCNGSVTSLDIDDLERELSHILDQLEILHLSGKDIWALLTHAGYVRNVNRNRHYEAFFEKIEKRIKSVLSIIPEFRGNVIAVKNAVLKGRGKSHFAVTVKEKAAAGIEKLGIRDVSKWTGRDGEPLMTFRVRAAEELDRIFLL